MKIVLSPWRTSSYPAFTQLWKFYSGDIGGESKVNLIWNIEGLHIWGLCVEVHLRWNGSYAGGGHGTQGGCNADRRTSHPPMVTRNTPDLGKQKLHSLLDLEISLVWDNWTRVLYWFFTERFSRQIIFLDLPLIEIVLYSLLEIKIVWGGAIVGCGIAIQGVSQSEKIFRRVYSTVVFQCGSQVGRLYSQYSIETHSSAIEFRIFSNISIFTPRTKCKVLLNQIFSRVVAWVVVIHFSANIMLLTLCY